MLSLCPKVQLNKDIYGKSVLSECVVDRNLHYQNLLCLLFRPASNVVGQ